MRTPRWLPRLAQAHPGYFRVVIALSVAHVLFGLDSLRGQVKNVEIFEVVARVLSDQLWLLTVLHFMVAVLILVGLYIKDAFFLLRFGCALSMAIFNVLAVAFAFAAIDLGLSFALPVSFVALSVLSYSAAREPEQGPRHR